MGFVEAIPCMTFRFDGLNGKDLGCTEVFGTSSSTCRRGGSCVYQSRIARFARLMGFSVRQRQFYTLLQALLLTSPGRSQPGGLTFFVLTQTIPTDVEQLQQVCIKDRPACSKLLSSSLTLCNGHQVLLFRLESICQAAAFETLKILNLTSIQH